MTSLERGKAILTMIKKLECIKKFENSITLSNNKFCITKKYHKLKKKANKLGEIFSTHVKDKTMDNLTNIEN